MYILKLPLIQPTQYQVLKGKFLDNETLSIQGRQKYTAVSPKVVNIYLNVVTLFCYCLTWTFNYTRYPKDVQYLRHGFVLLSIRIRNNYASCTQCLKVLNTMR